MLKKLYNLFRTRKTADHRARTLTEDEFLWEIVEKKIISCGMFESVLNMTFTNLIHQHI